MDTEESLREIAILRLRFQMNNRLRLECLAALSKVFREHGEHLSDPVLASLVFALPEELPGERSSWQASPPAGQPPTGDPPEGQPPPGQPPAGGPPAGKPPGHAPSRKVPKRVPAQKRKGG